LEVGRTVTREVTARAPTRIDLGGGWTDVPPYCDREGGFVCNIAISRYATARLTAVRGATSVSVRDASSVNVRESRVTEADTILIRAALRRSGVDDVVVSLENDFPVGAGLGGSSAASAALLGALSEWRGEPWDAAEIGGDSVA